MAGISDVAERAGVSTASVSRVLSGKNVRPGVRERVMDAVQATGYRPNRAARSLRSTKTMTIGLVVADIQNAYFTQVSRAVEDAASREGYAVFLCNSDEDATKEANYLTVLRDENVAGVILAPTANTHKVIDLSSIGDMPLVAIDRPAGRLPADTVAVDNVAAAKELTTHLIGHGRRRIAGLFGMNSTTGRERHQGFVEALAANEIPLVPELTQFLPPREPDGLAATTKLLEMKPPPDAIIASNGLLAAGAFRALTRSADLCPTRVAFASFDDVAWTSMVKPAVTVIEQPTYEIGRTATELLLARIADPGRPLRSVRLPYRLIARQSCGC